jgi:hypothetical protein
LKSIAAYWGTLVVSVPIPLSIPEVSELGSGAYPPVSGVVVVVSVPIPLS